jgi:peptide deformylase
MILKILTQDEEIFRDFLTKPCSVVDDFGPSLKTLVTDMWDSMYAARGVGLAATQIGSSLRVAVIDTRQRSGSHREMVLVNPKIDELIGEQTGEEGCLSMPGLRWQITRAAVVWVTFQELNGRRRTMRTQDLLARAIQHECDHLDGVLCNSKAPPTEGEPKPKSGHRPLSRNGQTAGAAILYTALKPVSKPPNAAGTQR